MSTFGELLKQRMDSATPRVTQTALGKIVGVHRTTISDYVLNKYLPTEETFRRIHQVFPDKELYEAYFAAVGKPVTEHKPKRIIPENKTYNHYAAKFEQEVEQEAAEEKAKAAAFMSEAGPIGDMRRKLFQMEQKTTAEVTLHREYIARALKYAIESMEKDGTASLCPRDYNTYKELYKKYAK